VATLLRLATMEDHIFLLSHVLRCPAGIAKWAGGYVQPVPPVYSSHDMSAGWCNVLLDHFVTMLATILQPVRSAWSCSHHACKLVMAAVTIVRTGHSVLLLMCRSFFFRCLISEVAWPIVTKLCHMFNGDPDL